MVSPDEFPANNIAPITAQTVFFFGGGGGTAKA